MHITGRQATVERRFQDAIKAYTLSLCYKFHPSPLAMRAQVYAEMENFRYAYIDATEALKLNGSIEEDSKLSLADLVQTHCVKAHALAALGFTVQARVAREVAQRVANQLDDEEFKADFLNNLQNINVAPQQSLATDFLTTYDPLESDDPTCGRELLLGDISRIILNKFKPPCAEDDRIHAFDFDRWHSISRLNALVASSISKNETRDSFKTEDQPDAIFDLTTLQLCFRDDSFLVRATLKLHEDPKFAYVNARKSLELAHLEGNLSVLSQSSFMCACALSELGHFQRAKKVLEVALRVGGALLRSVDVLYVRLLSEEKDNPKVSTSALDECDPFSGNSYCEDILRRVRPAYIKAVAEVYGENSDQIASLLHQGPVKKLYADVDETSPPELIAEVATAAEAAFREKNWQESRRLFTIVHVATKRENTVYLMRRANATMKCRGIREWGAYIDANEAIKLNQQLVEAYECKAKALVAMGCVKRAKTTLNVLRKVDSSYRVCPHLLEAVRRKKDCPMFAATYLERYDPTLTDYFGYDCSLTKDERKVVADLQAIDTARKLISFERYAKAISALQQPIQALPLPDVLTMRATCFLRTKEPLKAYNDATEALKLGKWFHDAICVQANALFDLGLYSKARCRFREYLRLMPCDDDAQKLLSTIEEKVNVLSITRTSEKLRAAEEAAQSTSADKRLREQLAAKDAQLQERDAAFRKNEESFGRLQNENLELLQQLRRIKEGRKTAHSTPK